MVDVVESDLAKIIPMFLTVMDSVNKVEQTPVAATEELATNVPAATTIADTMDKVLTVRSR